MQATTQAAAATAPASSGVLWAGRAASALATPFLALDGAAKLVRPAAVFEGTLEVGYPESVIVPLGLVLLACVALYAIPQTAVLGAILLTGYLGGAIASAAPSGQAAESRPAHRMNGVQAN